MNCRRCKWVRSVTVFPYHCQCGNIYWGKGGDLSTRQPAPAIAKPRTFGIILRELVGCGCPIGWRKWDHNGLQWCRDNAEQIAQRLTAEPRPAIPIDRARELVAQALRIAERSSGSSPSSD